jgi:WD40 repeat protein
MFDRSLATSGFDTETLVSERYVTYLLLAQIEAGLMALEFNVVKTSPPTNLTVIIHPPAGANYERLYNESQDPPLPDPVNNSLLCRLLPGEASGFCDLGFTQDGKLLTRSYDNMVRVWDVITRSQNEQLAFEVEPAIGSAFNAAGTQIATAAVDHDIRIWDLATKSVIQTLTGHTLAAWCVAFSPDGQRLVSGSFDQTIRIWDLQTGMLLHTLAGHDGRVTSVAFKGDGTQIVSGGEDGTVRVWDAQTGAPLGVFMGHTGAVNCVTFSLTGFNVVSGSDDKTVRVCNSTTGNLLRNYNEHTDAVNWVDVGTSHIISASRDKSIKLWEINQLSSVRTVSDHRSEVTRAMFSGTGPANFSVSAGGSIRTWADTNKPDTIEVRMDFMHVAAFVTIIDHNANDATHEGFIGLIVYMALYADRSANGLESNHVLRLSFAKLDDPTKNLLETQGIDVELVEQTLREQLDRDLPLGIAQGQQVQQIQMRKFFDEDDNRTLGIYVDLALHAGPGDNYVAPRGNALFAQSFRAPDVEIAFATSPGLFALLGPDAKYRRAELAPGTTEYRYPFREDEKDSSSKELGIIESFSIGPTYIVDANGNVINLGKLHIEMEGEYTDTTPNFGFTAHFWFFPKRDAQGIVEWEPSVDLDLGPLATVLMLVGGILLLTPLAKVGVAIWLLVGTVAALVGREVAEVLLSKKLAEEVDEESQASVLDSLPFRLPAAKRRWDPFYETEHQIVAKLNEPMIIDVAGIAFEGQALALDKQPVLNADIAPHDEVRENGDIVALRYDVPDAAQFATDFEAKGPGVDRRDFVRSDPVTQPRLVTLTLDQVAARKTEQRILAPIVLDARRINMFSGQIDRLLCATWRVRTQQRDRLITLFQQRTRDEIVANDLAQIQQDATTALTAKLGRAPTDEELAKEVELRIQSLIKDLQKEYESGDLREDLHDALAPLLHFDVAPEELVALQERGFFTLDGKVIIVRENDDGSHTPYYRDYADRDPRDNLLSLPHYQYPYVPPSP